MINGIQTAKRVGFQGNGGQYPLDMQKAYDLASNAGNSENYIKSQKTTLEIFDSVPLDVAGTALNFFDGTSGATVGLRTNVANSNNGPLSMGKFLSAVYMYFDVVTQTAAGSGVVTGLFTIGEALAGSALMQASLLGANMSLSINQSLIIDKLPTSSFLPQFGGDGVFGVAGVAAAPFKIQGNLLVFATPLVIPALTQVQVSLTGASNQALAGGLLRCHIGGFGGNPPQSFN